MAVTTGKDVGRKTVKSIKKCSFFQVDAKKPLLSKQKMGIRHQASIFWTRLPLIRFKDVILSDDSRFCHVVATVSAEYGLNLAQSMI